MRFRGIAVALLGLVAGCEGNPVGRQCFIGADASLGGSTVVVSPSLECQSRDCLRFEGHQELCTAECEVDDDCDKEGDTCDAKFICGVATVTGPFACKKLCVCEDFVSGDAGLPTPAACQ